MAELNYTKVVWELEGKEIKAFGKGTIAICPSPTNDKGVLEFIANAQLIASAPDLYEACKEAERTIDSALAKGTFLPNLNRAVRKALAKAEAK